MAYLEAIATKNVANEVTLIEMKKNLDRGVGGKQKWKEENPFISVDNKGKPKNGKPNTSLKKSGGKCKCADMKDQCSACGAQPEMLAKMNEQIVNSCTTNEGIHLPPLVAPISIILGNNKETKTVLAYFDPGAKDGCYVSKEMGKMLAQKGIPRTTCKKLVCGGVGNERCEVTDECFTVELMVKPDSKFNKLNNVMAITTIVSSVQSEYDMIIGLPVFRKYGLFQVLSPLLEGKTERSECNLASKSGPTVTSKSFATTGGRTDQPQCSSDVATSSLKKRQEFVLTDDVTTNDTPQAGGEKGWGAQSSKNPGVGKYYTRTNGGKLLKERDLLGGSDADLECEKTPIFDDKNWEKHRLQRLRDQRGNGSQERTSSITTPATTINVRGKTEEASTPGWLTPAEEAELGPELPVRIYGTPSERKQLIAVCIKHKEAFGNKLRREPAKLTPLTFTVDEDKWFNNRANQQPPRLQSQVKDQAIWKQVHDLEDLKVVIPCFPKAWSQVLLVKKLNDEFRMCFDYRGLNESIPSYGGAIPRIPDMLQRLGKQRPTRFGLMDLKNGYWQAPLAGSVQEYTAFITSFGSYMFTRIPMGIKPAGPYFQHMMATVVFVGFVYIILELYLDDFAVHDQGKGFDQFVINLELVLKRLIEKNVIVSPMKTVLNVPEVEFVGHQISEDGIHFTAAKLDKVAQVDRPVWGRASRHF